MVRREGFFFDSEVLMLKYNNYKTYPSQGPHSQILMTEGGGGGGATEVHIIYPKKSQLQNLSTQKNHYFS